MNNNPALLRHDILNIITLINFSLFDADLEKKKKEEILGHLKMASLLVSQQDVFLGKEKKFLKQRIDLNEVLELVYLILKKQIKRKKIKVSIAPTNLVLVGDNKIIKEGLEQLLLNVMGLSKNIAVKVSERSRKLSIKYDSMKKLSMNKVNPIEYLKEKRSYSEIFFRTAMYLMEAIGIKTTFKKGLVEVVFPG